jgi:hypothetical protein
MLGLSHATDADIAVTMAEITETTDRPYGVTSQAMTHWPPREEQRT